MDKLRRVADYITAIVIIVLANMAIYFILSANIDLALSPQIAEAASNGISLLIASFIAAFIISILIIFILYFFLIHKEG